MIPVPRLTYSVSEVAKITGLSPRSVRYLVAQGRLGFVKLGRRVLIRHGDLEVLLRRHYVRPSSALDADTPIRPRADETGPRDGNAAPTGQGQDGINAVSAYKRSDKGKHYDTSLP